jgi:signal transduction histidine kinase
VAKWCAASRLALAGELRHISPVLDRFLVSNRATIIARAQARVASRPSPKATAEELADGIPMFLDQLGVALRLAKSSDRIDHEQISASAGRHGLDLLRMGLTIAQVVHDYGDICQVVTELAVQQAAPISSEEFRTLNLCLDDAIAGAVTAYAGQREHVIADQGNERLGVLAHELRNVVNTAMLSFDAMKSGRVAVGGSTALLHGRSLMRLRDLVDGSLAVVRLDAGIERRERISVADFLGEVEIAAVVQAQALGIRFTMTTVDRLATIEGDRQLLVATVSNLLQNAFKFTREHGSVSLGARAAAGRVLFEIEDECGGLPPGKTEELFRPFEQRGVNRSGVGLGLSICLKTARAHGGEIRVRDLPGKGCVFTLDLPAAT